MREWFSIRATAGGEREILIYDAIGASFEGDRAISAQAFIDQLRVLPADVRAITVRVNSPGGNPFEAAAMATALREERARNGRSVKVCIDGIAASAATVVTCAGGTIEMVSNGLFMIHDPYTSAVGTADEFRDVAKALDAVRDSIVSAYQWVSPKTAAQLRDMMKATTWMSAAEAKAAGFITHIVGTNQATQAAIRPEIAARLGAPPARLRREAAAVIGVGTGLSIRDVYSRRSAGGGR